MIAIYLIGYASSHHYKGFFALGRKPVLARARFSLCNAALSVGLDTGLKVHRHQNPSLPCLFDEVQATEGSSTEGVPEGGLSRCGSVCYH